MIQIKIDGNDIWQSEKNCGVSGEAYSTEMVVCFSEDWAEYIKKIVFYDALGGNPVTVLLTEGNKTAENPVEVYKIKIPSEPLVYEGDIEFVVSGSTADGAVKKSVAGKLRVRYSPSSESEKVPAEVAQTVGEQLAAEAERISKENDRLEARVENFENRLPATIEYWQPNTEYKVGQYVLAIRGNKSMAICKCIKAHLSPADATYVWDTPDEGEYWETLSSTVHRALYDDKWRMFSTTYATKEHQISVWSPNTTYKKGEWVFTIDDENPFRLDNLYVCTENHVSGDTFTVGSVWGGRSLKAYIALRDQLGNHIIGTYATKTELNDLGKELANAEAIAKGRATGYVFDTKEDMDAWLANSSNTEQLVLGDNLYIRATDVPDYWWDGTQVQQLETQKVDLSEYVKVEDIEDLQGQISQNTSALPNKIEYWRPNTAYKAGQYVLFGLISQNATSSILYCLQDHVSGITPSAGGQYWGAHSFRATEAQCDIHGDIIHTTYAKKTDLANYTTTADLTAAIGEALEGDY